MQSAAEKILFSVSQMKNLKFSLVMGDASDGSEIIELSITTERAIPTY